MTRRTKQGLLALSLFVAAGCTTAIPYSPSPIASREEALRQVDRLLREQPEGHTPLGVEVTDEYFSVLNRHLNPIVGISVEPQTVYFDSVDSIRLSKRRSWFWVVLYDETQTPLFHYYHLNRTKAERFVDAIDTLSHQAADPAK